MATNEVTDNLIEDFCADILRQKDRVKSINSDISDAFKAFAKEHGLTVDSLKASYKNYEAYEKDPKKFIQVDTEADMLTRKLIKQYREVE